MRVISVESTELFTGTAEHPHQVVAVEIGHDPGRQVRLTLTGDGVHGVDEPLVTIGEDGTVRAEISVTSEGLAPGDRREITVTAEEAGAVVRHDNLQVLISLRQDRLKCFSNESFGVVSWHDD